MPDNISESEEEDFIELINIIMNNALNEYNGWVDSVDVEGDVEDGEDDEDDEDEDKDDDESTTHD